MGAGAGCIGSGRARVGLMATYTFKAVDLAGVPAAGELEADSKQAVTDQLRERGLIVLDIVEEKTSAHQRGPVRPLQEGSRRTS